MLQKYERKADDILEKLAQEEPNERNFKLMAEALIVKAGAEVMEMMGKSKEQYDGRRMDEYYRGGRRRDGMGRFRYDGAEAPRMGDGDTEYWDDGDEDGEDDELDNAMRVMYEHYNGRGVSRRNGRRKGARKNISGGIK